MHSFHRLAFITCVLAGVLTSAPASAQTVLINELMASNTSALADEDGDFSDWIEIFNSGGEAVDLTGYGLSDDPDDPFKWTMPALTMPPGAHSIIFASDKDRGIHGGHWETIVDLGASWSYRVNAQPPSEWRTPGFDASAWSTGPSGIGYGDGDDATDVPRGSLVVFARTTFTVEDPSQIERAVMHIDYDDGFVAYLNGTEIARANVSGSTPGSRQSSDVDREAGHYAGLPLDDFEIANASSFLQPGENVLAVQVHNVSANSSDLTLIPILTFGLTEPPPEPRGLSDLAGSLARERPHTNYALSSGGETIVLTAPGGTVVDEIMFPALGSDVSFGRSPDGADDWVLFAAPSPEGPNASAGFAGTAATPTLSLPAGRYDTSALTVAVEGDTEQDIRYSIDGSVPTKASPLYSGPLNITTTTVVRARAFAPGYLPSTVATATYLLGEDTNLPIISISTDPDNLWNYETGIYELGPNAQSADPHYGANFWQDWEIPAHVELLEPGASTPALSFGAGLKIFGGWSRAHPQKSLSIFARGRYGTDAIEYPLIPDKPIAEYQSFVLRNGGNDFYYTIFRDAMMQYLIKDSGVDILGYRPAIIFINGAYWGIQNIREKVNEHYAAANHPGVDPDNVDMLEVVSAPTEFGIVHGSDEHFRSLLDYVESSAMTSSSDFEFVDSMMDVDEFIDYQIAQIYYFNGDWPGNNVKLWRPRVPGGRWRWVLYDTDFGFGLYDANYSHPTLNFATAANGPSWPNPPHSTLLLRRLLENPGFRSAFINRFADHLNYTFQPDRVNALIDRMADGISEEVPRHNQRWNGALSRWSSEVDRMRTFADRRIGFMRSHLRNFFGLSPLVPMTLDTDGPGSIRIHHLEVHDFPRVVSYFPGQPVKVEAVPAPGYRFAGWSGDEAGSHPVLTIDPSAGLRLEARFEPGSIGAVVINEIQYNPPEDLDTEDWIELYNAGDATVDVGGWTFTDEDSTHTFAVPANTLMAANTFLVLCRDPLAFSTAYSGGECVGPWDFGLGSGGDVVRLFDADGALVDSVAYDDEMPWPTEPDGGGATLELTAGDRDNSLAESWVASSVHGGTPGAVNSVSVSIESSAPELTFTLHPNHPNPFRESTTIRYELDRPGRAVVSVFDLLGREVHRLVDGNHEAGIHTRRFDASDLASGVYVCRLEIAGRTRSRTMLVLR